MSQRLAYVTLQGAYLTICLVVALTVGDISLILSVCGSTGSTTVAYILPGIAYYVMLYDEAPKWKRWGALALGILGLVVMPVCLAFNFL
ncbi:hypothetical protein EON64_03965 [archaeon]|nr:MAG: hypothetical protein EON64_03965 [archaeon]